jgi:hypothetical protein
VKFRHRAPDDYLLLRCFAGGSRRPELLARDDDDLVRLAQSDLRAILGITAAPVLTRVYRWHNGNPQYDVGHLDRIAALEARCPDGLLLAGRSVPRRRRARLYQTGAGRCTSGAGAGDVCPTGEKLRFLNLRNHCENCKHYCDDEH